MVLLGGCFTQACTQTRVGANRKEWLEKAMPAFTSSLEDKRERIHPEKAAPGTIRHESTNQNI